MCARGRRVVIVLLMRSGIAVVTMRYGAMMSKRHAKAGGHSRESLHRNREGERQGKHEAGEAGRHSDLF